MTVSVSAMAGMAAAALLAVGFPVVCYVFFARKYGSRFFPALVGMATFSFFALVLESFFHVGARQDAGGIAALLEQPVFYMFYAGLTAGIFEETGRLLSFFLLRKRRPGFATALSYGVGHGGIEAILLVGIPLCFTLVQSVFINTGGMAALLPTLQEPELSQVQALIQSLVNTPGVDYLWGGLERVLSVTLHISLSVMMWYAVNGNKRIWLYPVAVVLHAVVNFPAALMQVGVITSLALTEGLILLGVAMVAAVALLTHRRLRDEPKAEAKIFSPLLR